MRATWRTGLGAGAAALLLAGCGGGGNDFADKDPQDIAKAAAADMKDLSSLHLQGDLTTGGEKLDLDMQVTTSGDCQGSIGVAQGKAQILSSNGQAYMKPDKAFWESTTPGTAAQIETVVGDKWVLVPSASGFGKLCDLDQLLQGLGENDPTGKPTAAAADSVDGKDAVKLTGKDKDGNPVTAWVASDSPHYILKIQQTQGSEPGTLTMSGFNEKVAVQAPPQDQVIDLSKLGG
jgi:hypothetical protein